MKSSTVRAPLSVGELAALFGLATHVLRHWESVGLLAPARLANGRRRYGVDDIYRVAAILNVRETGLPLDQIRDLLDTPEPAVRRQILRRQHTELADRIARLRSSLDLIEKGLACKHEDFTHCPNYRAHVESRIGAPAQQPACQPGHGGRAPARSVRRGPASRTRATRPTT